MGVLRESRDAMGVDEILGTFRAAGWTDETAELVSATLSYLLGSKKVERPKRGRYRSVT